MTSLSVAAALDSPPMMETTRPTVPELFAEHARFVWRVLAAHGVAGPDVKDATQEVFLVAHRREADWDPARASARTWLHGIAVKIAANHRRRAYLRHEAPGTPPPPQTFVSDPAEDIDRARLVARLYEVLDHLTPKQREIIVLFDLHGLSMKETAEIVGCPLRTAYTRWNEGRSRIAEALGRLEGGDL